MYKAKKNIKHIYARRIIEEENLWYWDNHWKGREIATSSRINWQEFHHCMLPLSKVLGVISSLSPRTNWNDNLKLAETHLKTGDCGTIGQFKDKARRILFSDGYDDTILSILNGNKIKSFYMNLMYPDEKEFVTIDRHAISIVLGREATNKERSLTDKQYQFFSECYKEVARELDILPNFLQSITWQAWKRIKSAK
jgi:hypothetical protein